MSLTLLLTLLNVGIDQINLLVGLSSNAALAALACKLVVVLPVKSSTGKLSVAGCDHSLYFSMTYLPAGWLSAARVVGDGSGPLKPLSRSFGRSRLPTRHVYVDAFPRYARCVCEACEWSPAR